MAKKRTSEATSGAGRETINRSISFSPGDFEFLEFLGKFQRNENRSAVISIALKALWQQIASEIPTGLNHPKDWPPAIRNHFNKH